MALRRWTFTVGLFLESCPVDSSLDVCAEPERCELFHQSDLNLTHP
jgi:hypothetical protein